MPLMRAEISPLTVSLIFTRRTSATLFRESGGAVVMGWQSRAGIGIYRLKNNHGGRGAVRAANPGVKGLPGFQKIHENDK